MRSILGLVPLALIIGLSLVGCGEDGTVDLTPTPEGETPTVVPNATFTRVYDEVITVSCAFGSCHGSGTGGLTLKEGVAYGNLVGPESSVRAGAILVVPGDPDSSYVMKKLKGSPSITGDPMPPPSGLDDDRIALVEAWILAGALDD